MLRWNRAAEVMFGFRRNEAVGHLLAEQVVLPDRVEEEQRIQHDAQEPDYFTLSNVKL